MLKPTKIFGEIKKLFVAFPWVVSNQYWAGRVNDMCVYYMTGAPEGSLKAFWEN